MRRLTYSLFAVLFLFACGPDKGDGATDGGGGDGDGGGGMVDAQPPCSTAEECGTGVCDPNTSTCTPDLPCTTHDQCGPGGHCQTDGTCARSATGDPCDTQTQCTMNEGCVGGYCGCGGDEYIAEAVPPNVLIVLDRSGSMNGDVGGMSKYQIAQTAISNLLTTYGNTVRFGLALYPSDNDCGSANVNVNVDLNTASAINSAISATPPVSSALTPIGDSLDALINYAGLEDATRENYILLITDGSETCSGDGRTAVTNLVNETPSVRTFVVGFGSGVDESALNDMAQNGMTALPGGPPYYYQADDAASLNQALDDIGGAVLSCTYVLDQVPENADFFVYFDDSPIGEDAVDGWTYDAGTNTVTFSGAACDALRTGSVADLVIVHNCPVDVN